MATENTLDEQRGCCSAACPVDMHSATACQGFNFYPDSAPHRFAPRGSLSFRALLSAVQAMCRRGDQITVGAISARLMRIIFPTDDAASRCVLASAVDSADRALAIKFLPDEQVCEYELNVRCSPSDMILLPIGGDVNCRIFGHPLPFHIIVYPLLNGCDLLRFIQFRSRGAQSDPEVDRLANIYMAYALLAGIAHMHDSRLAHCDMKPENVMTCFIAGRWCLKIIDLGEATPFPDLRNHLGGTKSYDPPEVKAARECGATTVTSARDIYSAGRTLYVTFSGKQPTYNKNGLKARDVIPTWLLRLLQRMMDNAPELRPTADECLMEIRRNIGQERVFQDCYICFEAMMDRIFCCC
jgi:hypothetical protein